MKHLLENWRRLLEESDDFKPHTMYDPNSDQKEEAKNNENTKRAANTDYKRRVE